LDTALRRYFGRFRLCYQNALRNNPNLAGRVAMALAIDADGSVTSAEINKTRTTLSSDAAVKCVLDGIRGVPFPQATPPASTEARVDLQFGFD
jgi:hypothetical protein